MARFLVENQREEGETAARFTTASLYRTSTDTKKPNAPSE
jgi:hypothetical protein